MRSYTINWRPITPSPFGGRWRGGPWRLLSSLADYAEPWKPLTWNDLCSEFPTSEEPYQDYINHLCGRYEGEVALAWQNWQWSPYALPRDKALWDPQFSINNNSHYAFAKLPNGSNAEFGDNEFDDNVNLLAVGNTKSLRARNNSDGYWYLEGAAITLGELLAQFGARFTVAELMF